MAVKNKHRCELLLPAASGWELWVGPEAGPLELEQVFEETGLFTREGQRHALSPFSQAGSVQALAAGSASACR